MSENNDPSGASVSVVRKLGVRHDAAIEGDKVDLALQAANIAQFRPRWANMVATWSFPPTPLHKEVLGSDLTLVARPLDRMLQVYAVTTWGEHGCPQIFCNDTIMVQDNTELANMIAGQVMENLSRQ